MQTTFSRGLHLLVIMTAGIFYIVCNTAQAQVHGCTPETAQDLRGQGTVELAAWSFPHNQCVVVSPGTTVHWSGNLAAHPLVGGVVPSIDGASPITSYGGTSTVATVIFTAEGDFPYFCKNHLSNMSGVIYVRPADNGAAVFDDGFEDESPSADRQDQG